MTRDTGTMSLRDCVFESLQNATDNGYAFNNMSYKDIVVDLKDLDADLQDEDPAELERHVAAWWRENHR